MSFTKIILADASYVHSNTSITFTLKDEVFDEDNKIFYLDTCATYENQEIKLELALFDSDLDYLKHLEVDNPVTEIYFIEPDLHFTIIDCNQELLCIYIDFDSGLRHSNMVTESGISLRINVTKTDFTKFINELASLD
ncbi:hypothetical protein [Staphylococcus argenteus]|uniref:hypothetical protein n=1 Tax=Staphylococcus argenteus TaxID=985002 RepID=UPI00092336C3|nr:hypothetical protein [Staphylococcus argenteus]MCG9855098.1 hypothetical protein [Staphylococcus argenteus]MDR7650305.1 hypothetical protein [Staphylococcus argenteus]MDR7682980.1 hypothetical protein [Staphylococcus argenteus]SGX22613.1 Uncharacterised protein [Staphylococcus argenteus]SGX62015.1 Uncharacterised protein [Staphylococcus argenteus]